MIGQSVSTSIGFYSVMARLLGGVAPPPEIHVFIIAGQSNAVGQAPDDGGDVFPVTSMHFGASNAWQSIVSRVYHNQSPGQPERPDGAASFGWARTFATAYQAENPTVQLYFIGAAKGSTSFVGNDWNPGNAVYNASVARVNAAIAALPVGAVLKGILWHQGESDKLLTGEATYEAAIKAFIPAYRAAITGGSSVPFVLGGQFYLGGAYGETVQNVVQSMPNSIALTGYADSSSPVEVAVQADSLHATAAAARLFGPQYLKGLKEAAANTALTQVGAGITLGSMSQYALAASTTPQATGVALGTPSADRILVVAVHWRSNFVMGPREVRINGIDMARMATGEHIGTRCDCMLFYANVPTGTTGVVDVVFSSAPNATQAAISVLPVYGARPHLARVNGYAHTSSSSTSVASISSTINVKSGDLVVAAAGSINAGTNTGAFTGMTTITGQFGGAFAAHLGYVGIIADAVGYAVACTFSTPTQRPALCVMTLRPI